MIELIHDNQLTIAELCRHHGLRKLEVFGSAATGEFDPATRDFKGLLRHRVEMINQPLTRNPFSDM